MLHSDYYLSRFLHKTIMTHFPDRAHLFYIFNSYFVTQYQNRGTQDKPISDMDRYYAGAKYVFCDLFAKKYLLVPVNKQCVQLLVLFIHNFMSLFHSFHWYLIVVKNPAMALCDSVDNWWEPV